MQAFEYTALPCRVTFGFGTRFTINERVDELGCKRLLLLATAEQAGTAQELAAHLSLRAAGVFAGAAMHTPVEVTEAAIRRVAACKADGVISIGGGSTIGLLGKAIALRTDLPQFALPTTYAGSEMTPILGETYAGKKTTQRTPKVLPEIVIYDVDLTLSLPVRLSVTSGMNAIAHAAESLYAEKRNPIVAMMAEESIGALARALPKLAVDPLDREARSAAFYGAWLAGVCLGSVGMALHHKLCHVLGGTFNLPHAETHAILLPHVLAFNSRSATPAIEAMARALNADDPPSFLHELGRQLGVPHNLAQLGMPEQGIERAANIVMQSPYWNPRPLELNAIRDLIRRAWAGESPT